MLLNQAIFRNVQANSKPNSERPLWNFIHEENFSNHKFFTILLFCLQTDHRFPFVHKHVYYSKCLLCRIKYTEICNCWNGGWKSFIPFSCLTIKILFSKFIYSIHTYILPIKHYMVLHFLSNLDIPWNSFQDIPWDDWSLLELGSS